MHVARPSAVVSNPPPAFLSFAQFIQRFSPPDFSCKLSFMPVFSINRGKKDNQKAQEVMNTSFTMVCGSGIILMIAGMLFARPLLVLFGASEDALVYAYPYMMIYLIGTIPSMISIGMNPFINAQGYSTIGMLSVAIGAVANLLLDPLFIFVLGFGVQGAAIATILSQTLSAAFVLFFLTRKSELKVRFQF